MDNKAGPSKSFERFDSVQKAPIKAANATLWEKINHFGYERVEKIADEIDQKSKVLSNECIDDTPPSPPTAKIQVSGFNTSVTSHNA